MFTIKHYSDTGKGDYIAYACDTYRVENLKDGGICVSHWPVKGGEPIGTFARKGEIIFIENIAGKTIDVLRPSGGVPMEEAA